jgi:hypothetical protein
MRRYEADVEIVILLTRRTNIHYLAATDMLHVIDLCCSDALHPSSFANAKLLRLFYAFIKGWTL